MLHRFEGIPSRTFLAALIALQVACSACGPSGNQGETPASPGATSPAVASPAQGVQGSPSPGMPLQSPPSPGASVIPPDGPQQVMGILSDLDLEKKVVVIVAHAVPEQGLPEFKSTLKFQDAAVLGDAQEGDMVKAVVEKGLVSKMSVEAPAQAAPSPVPPPGAGASPGT